MSLANVYFCEFGKVGRLTLCVCDVPAATDVPASVLEALEALPIPVAREWRQEIFETDGAVDGNESREIACPRATRHMMSNGDIACTCPSNGRMRFCTLLLRAYVTMKMRAVIE